MPDVICPECGCPMVLKVSAKYGKFYGCSNWPACTITHGAHQNSGKPLGFPADLKTKKFRSIAHHHFDKLWKTGRMSRRNAYKWLQTKLGLSRHDCHIGKFDILQCKEVIDACKNCINE